MMSISIAIWGTGAYYNWIKRNIDFSTVECLIDTNEAKQGSILDGIQIASPKDVDFSRFDYVVVAVRNFRSVIEQLYILNVETEKIITYQSLSKILNINLDLEIHDFYMNSSDEKLAAVVVDDLGYTGILTIGIWLAEALMEIGYKVLFVGLRDGVGEKELQDRHLQYVKNYFFYLDNEEKSIDFSKFDLVFALSLKTGPIVKKLSETMLVYWWIHESKPKLFSEFGYIPQKVKYISGAKRSTRCMKEYWKLSDSDIVELFYYIPESNSYNKKTNDIFAIAVIGTIDARKGQDVLGEAIRLLPQQYRKSMRALCVGEISEKDFYDMLRNKYPFLEITGHKKQCDIYDLYTKINLVVCPSRDDPMPIAVSQAFQNSVPVAISTEVGQSEFITDYYDGFLFENENYEQLAKIITWIMDNNDKAREIGENGRLLYDMFFSKESFVQKLQSVIH